MDVMQIRAGIAGVSAALLYLIAVPVLCQSVAASKTQVVMLGTGTPYADPERSGPATAIVVNGTPYLVDCGPGVVRRIAQAHKNGVEGLTPQKVAVLFITHLHSDHTVGYPDVIFMPGSEWPFYTAFIYSNGRIPMVFQK